MIDSTRSVTVTKTGLQVLAEGDSVLELYTFGNILLLRPGHCVVKVVAGPMAGQKIRLPLTFPAVVDGVTYHVDVPDQQPTAPKLTSKRVRPVAGQPTKMDKCRKLFADNRSKPKNEIVEMFVNQAGCTAAGANTYYITLRKQFAVG